MTGKLSLYTQVEKGLKDMFPGMDIDVMPRDYDRRLICTVMIDGKQTAWTTPQGMDVRSLSAPEWMHRFAAEIRKLNP